MRKKLLLVGVCGSAAAAAWACVEPPPKIAAIPPSGLSIRLHVFGANAMDAKQTFDAAKQNNKTLHIVQQGGDGEVLVGLDNDSPKCVEPTALCSYKVVYRVKNANGEVVALGATSASANADRCSDLCARALNQVTVKVLEVASAALKGGGATIADASADPPEAGAVATSDEGGAPADAGAADAEPEGKPKPKTGAKKKPKEKEPPPAEPKKAEPIPLLCTVGPGNRLKSEDAERRAAQVDALKRLGILEQAEYDCLRKAYLERL